MKLYLYIAAALAIIGLMWGAVHVWNKAQRLDAVEAEYKKFQKDTAAHDKAVSQAIANAQGRSQVLAEQLSGTQAELNRLRGEHINPVVNREKPATNGKCDDPRISPDWLRIYNEASDASAVHPPA